MILEKDLKISVKQSALTSSRLTTTVSIVNKMHNGDKKDVHLSSFDKRVKIVKEGLMGDVPTKQRKNFVILVRCSATELSVISIHRKKKFQIDENFYCFLMIITIINLHCTDINLIFLAAHYIMLKKM